MSSVWQVRFTQPGRLRHALAGTLRKPHFYYSIAFLVTVGAFWPSFFSKLSSTDAAHSIHGITATLWMAVPVLQSWLISRKRFTLHRRLGWITVLILAPLLVGSGLHMVRLMVGPSNPVERILIRKFAFLDLCALTLFVAFLVLAVMSIRSRDIELHMRYMTGTVLFALEPALERVFVFYVPGVAGFESALYYAVSAMELIAIVLLYFEWQRRMFRSPIMVALGFFVAMHVLMTPVAKSVAFTNFAAWFART